MKRLSVLLAFLGIFCSLVVHAQVTVVKGKVTSAEDGSSLPGATVLVTGTNTVTVTDADGNFTINVPSDAKSLTVKFVGMATKEIPIAGQATINVVMEPEVKGIDEVIVTAIGLKRSEKSLGYSATQVTSDEITQGRERSMLNSLQGKVAGVNISSGSGAPGASTKIILRGFSTLRENNQPLFIVDGMPINNDQVSSNFSTNNSPIDFESNKNVDFGNRANDINPEDIESVTVLKGAAASALYGSRAANGVILITTKNGKPGERIKVEYSGAASFSNPLRIPQFQSNFGQGWLGVEDLTQNGSWGPRLDGKMRVWGNVVDNSQLVKPYSAVKTALKDFYDVGQTYNNSINISGGSAASSFYLSYSNDNEDGIVPKDVDSYKRNTISVKGNTKQGRFSVNAMANYINKQQKYVPAGQGGSEGAVLYEDLLQVPANLSIVDLKDYKNKFFNLDNFYTPYSGNPYRILNENSNDYNEDRILGNVLAEFEVAKWLTAHWRVGADVANSQRKDWVAIAIPDPNGYNSSYAPVPGSVSERTFYSEDINSNFFLTSNNKVGADWNINLLAGYEALQQSKKQLAAKVEGLDIPYYYNIANSANQANKGTEVNDKRLFGLYGQVEFAFKEYLFTTISARNDWSSTLPKNNNSYFYPGISMSYLLSEAVPAVKDIFPYAKLRASWGMTGNDADPYKINNVYRPAVVQMDFGSLRFPFATNGFEVANTLGNPKLKPELTTEWELGTELRLPNNRITFDFSYYHKKTSNLITTVPLASSSGYTEQVQNVGEIENKGIELLLSIIPVKIGDFTWNASFNFTRNRGKVLKLVEGLGKVQLANAYDIDFVIKPGKALGVFEGPVPLRDAQGHIVVNAENGIPLQNPVKGEYGTAEAKYTLGITNKFTYKNISISGVFDIRQGGLIYSGTSDILTFAGNATKSLYNDRQPFIVPNSVIQTGEDKDGNPVYAENTTPIDMANMDSYYYHTLNKTSERDRVLDRSYIKLREVVISYDLPKKLFTKLPVKELTLGLVGRNLLLWTPKENNFIDPEVTTYGNDLSGEFGEFRGGPSIRTFGVTLRANF